MSTHTVSRKAPRASSTSRTLLADYCSITAQAVYNLWVAVAFMWGWAAAIVIIGLPLYEQRSIVNTGPVSSACALGYCASPG